MLATPTGLCKVLLPPFEIKPSALIVRWGLCWGSGRAKCSTLAVNSEAGACKHPDADLSVHASALNLKRARRSHGGKGK